MEKEIELLLPCPFCGKNNEIHSHLLTTGQIEFWNNAWAHQRIAELERALRDISEFHERDFDDLEKVHGFLGWTCCSQKAAIAQNALKELKRGK